MILVFFFLAAAVTFAEAWAAMLLIGAIHSEVPAMPSFGFAAAVYLVVLVNVLVGGAVRAGREV